jgi:hypothetical protein
MLSQDLIQVYSNEEGDAVIVVGVFEGVGKTVKPHHIVIPFGEMRLIATALNNLCDEIEQELI